MTVAYTSADAVMGKLGLPAPIAELAQRRWDAIIVGAGHNGLTCAAYLARAGKRVLVLEARERIGGACTLAEPFPGYHISPCAYLAGLLHRRVIDELNLPARGFRWMPAMAGYFVPFEDGSSILLSEDDDEAIKELQRFAPGDVKGWQAMQEVIARAREALRPDNDRDLWLDPAPTREKIENRLTGDHEALEMMFQLSMAQFVERYLSDERLQLAYLGQGVIGTNASPFDAGTAYIRFHHSCGRIDPALPGTWGYVEGGMGRVSFLICDAAREAGAVVATGTPVAQIIPREGVVLEGGERIHAPVIVVNADPRVAVRLLGDAVDSGWREQVQAIPMEGCTVKVNLALAEPPNFIARPGLDQAHHRAQINTPLSKHEWYDTYATARRGELPTRLWTENYLQTAFDPSIAPRGRHVLSMFCQYVPHTFAEGTWDDHRENAGRVAVESLGRFCSNIPNAVLDMEVLGPPDIEHEVGLTGGHIFQGECLPQFMWENRLGYSTPMPGVFLCGASTHPGGSVIAVNGRNAAIAVLGIRT